MRMKQYSQRRLRIAFVAKIVRDFFTGKPVAKIAKNQFRVTLPARSEAVPTAGKPFSTAVYVLSPK